MHIVLLLSYIFEWFEYLFTLLSNPQVNEHLRRFARLAENVCDGMKPGEQVALFGNARAHIDDLVEEVGTALRALERLGYEIVVFGKLRAAMSARVGAFRLGQVHLKCFAHFGVELGWSNDAESVLRCCSVVNARRRAEEAN
jgi:hypothetical protein